MPVHQPTRTNAAVHSAPCGRTVSGRAQALASPAPRTPTSMPGRVLYPRSSPPPLSLSTMPLPAIPHSLHRPPCRLRGLALPQSLLLRQRHRLRIRWGRPRSRRKLPCGFDCCHDQQPCLPRGLLWSLAHFLVFHRVVELLSEGQHLRRENRWRCCPLFSLKQPRGPVAHSLRRPLKMWAACGCDGVGSCMTPGRDIAPRLTRTETDLDGTDVPGMNG